MDCLGLLVQLVGEDEEVSEVLQVPLVQLVSMVHQEEEECLVMMDLLVLKGNPEKEDLLDLSVLRENMVTLEDLDLLVYKV